MAGHTIALAIFESFVVRSYAFTSNMEYRTGGFLVAGAGSTVLPCIPAGRIGL